MIIPVTFLLQQNETILTYMPWDSGYRYDMNNCLFNLAVTKIYWECRFCVLPF